MKIFLFCVLLLCFCLLKGEARKVVTFVNEEDGLLHGKRNGDHENNDDGNNDDENNDDGNNDEDDNGSSDGGARGYINGTQDVYTSTATITLTQAKKDEWVQKLDADKDSLDTSLKKLDLKADEKKVFDDDYAKLKQEVKDLTANDKTLTDIKTRVDKNGARLTPTSQQHLERVKSWSQTFLDNTPKLVDQIEKRDGWGAVATACTMLSSITGVIPHPVGIIFSTIFNLAAFFINLANSKKAKKEDPYKRIYKKIEEAVKAIGAHDRKMELSRMIAPLMYTQRISETFLRRGGKRFTDHEYMYWAISNNFPSMHSFVDSLSEIQNYVQIMKDELRQDRTVKLLIVAYTQISMMRDLLLADIPSLLPIYIQHNIDVGESLRTEYQFSLNRGKQSTFQFLETLHKPTPEMLWAVGWYFPPTQEDEDIKMLNTYLKGLSYLDDEDLVNVMPPAMVDEVILSKMKFKIITNVTDDSPPVTSHVTARTPASVGITKIWKDKKWVTKGWALNSRPHDYDNSFTFTPTENGYTKMFYVNVPNPQVGEDPPKNLEQEEDGMMISLNEGGQFYLLDKDYKLSKGTKREEFTIIPDNSKRENEPANVLTVMMGVKGDPTRFLGLYPVLGFSNKEEAEKEAGQNAELNQKKPVILQLIISNLQEVKWGIKSKYTDMEKVVNVGDNIHQMNEDIHFCRLIGRCKVSK